jgi:glycosyltransferase involved in cell wall biosynthesis
VGRFDPRKRPEMFFELAREFPDVDFIAVGESSDRKRQAMLTEMADKIPNLELTGAIDQFGSTLLAEILSKSWVIVNTSAREGLPTTFVEAAAHRCAILSFTNPDNFASRFGYNAAEGELSMGLMYLLQNDRWRSLGQSAYEFVAPVFGTENSIQAHFDMYEATRQRSHTDS